MKLTRTEYLREYHRKRRENPAIRARLIEYNILYQRRPEVIKRKNENKRERKNLETLKFLRIKKETTTDPNSLFAADDTVLRALAMDGMMLKKEIDKRKGSL